MFGALGSLFYVRNRLFISVGIFFLLLIYNKRFSLSVINCLDFKLVDVIKKEKQKLTNLGMDDSYLISFAIISSMKTVFMAPLTRDEFLSVLNAAKEKSLEVL